MRPKITLLAVLLVTVCMLTYAQTPTGAPAGTVMSESPADDKAIGLAGGKTFTFTNDFWPQWFSTCYVYGFDRTLNDIIDGFNTYPPNGNCPHMDDLTYNSSLSNLNSGSIVYTGYTYYKYQHSGGGYTSTRQDVRCYIKITEAGSTTPLRVRLANNRLLVKVTGDFKVNVTLSVLSPYSALNVTGGIWTPAITLFNNLHTDPGTSICTNFDPNMFWMFSVNATASNTGPYCIDETIYLSATGGTDYSWEGPGLFTSSISNPQIDFAKSWMSGNYMVAVVNNDAMGCSDIASTNVVVITDTEPPVPDLEYLDTITADCAVTVTDVPTATDNCAGLVLGTTTDTLEYDEEGTYTITWTYDDGEGRTSTQEQVVVIDDTIAPVPDSTSLEVLTGECSVTVTIIPTATDNCIDSIAGTTTDPMEYNTAGTYTITWTYDDGNGNSSTQEQTVIVEDEVDPIPDEATLPDLTDECSITLASVPTATDNCKGSISGTSSDPTEYTEQGSFTITWTYDDGNGNTVDQTQNVIIEDVTPPVIGCVDDRVKFADEGENEYIVDGTEFDLRSTEENCDVASLVNDHNDQNTLAGAAFSIGSHTITWTITDKAGNQGTCSFNLTVNEYVSMEGYQSEGIEVYPNPASGYLQIESLEEQSAVSVYNNTGKEMLTKQLHGQVNNLDISLLEKGFYILQVQTNDKIHTLKIIKDR